MRTVPRILKLAPAIALLFVWISDFQPSTALCQQPQAQQGQPIYAVNAKYVQGVGPGYWPTAGAGLTLNIAAGTAICGNPPVKVDYAGGTLTMTNAATNYVYLDPTASCVPAKNTTGFTAGVIPLAQVVAAGGVITGVIDVRTWFVGGGTGGGVTSLDTLTGAVTMGNGTVGTAPNWTHAGQVETLNIPDAGKAGVTAGTVSKTKYDAWDAKVGTHNLLSAGHPDTTTASAVRGDGIFAIGATPTWQRLAHPSTTGGYFKWNGTDFVASTGAASGTGACGANTWASTLNADAAPSCTQPGFSNLSGAATLAQLPFGAANQILGTNAAGTAQEHKTLSTGTAGTDFGIAHAANSIVFNLPHASATARGAVTTGAQTIAGAKTFSDSIILTGTTYPNLRHEPGTYEGLSTADPRPAPWQILRGSVASPVTDNHPNIFSNIVARGDIGTDDPGTHPAGIRSLALLSAGTTSNVYAGDFFAQGNAGGTGVGAIGIHATGKAHATGATTFGAWFQAFDSGYDAAIAGFEIDTVGTYASRGEGRVRGANIVNFPLATDAHLDWGLFLSGYGRNLVLDNADSGGETTAVTHIFVRNQGGATMNSRTTILGFENAQTPFKAGLDLRFTLASGSNYFINGDQLILANGARIYSGAQTTRDGVRGEVGTGGSIGSIYLSSAGKMYLKVANANATTDWEKVTTSAAD
jgi:hypothetical protein